MKTKLQFTLSKLGIAWMFALVTINFNRIAIVEVGVPAALIGLMIGLYPFFGPFQPLFRRITERRPIFGYHVSPYLVLGMVGGSLVFPFLPTVLRGMGAGEPAAYVAGFVLFFLFGAAIALMANTYLDLITTCTREDERSGVFAAAWTGQTAIMVVWAAVFRALMPADSFEDMQRLYALTPFVVTVLAIASVWKLEKRGRPALLEGDASLNTLRSSLQLLRGSASARAFFAFIVFSFLGIFTQDLVQEVWGGQVFGMRSGESAIFQQIFNGMVTVGMAAMGIYTAKRAAGRVVKTLTVDERKRIGAGAGSVAAAAFLLLAAVSHVANAAAAPAFFLMGGAVGVFTFCAVTLMSDMTVPGQTENYLGLWSIAQALGLGSSFIVSGVLHSALIGSGLLRAPAGFAVIFAVEGVLMFVCALSLRGASVERLNQDARSTRIGIVNAAASA